VLQDALLVLNLLVGRDNCQTPDRKPAPHRRPLHQVSHVTRKARFGSISDIGNSFDDLVGELLELHWHIET
jgi:hypothetical protein